MPFKIKSHTEKGEHNIFIFLQVLCILLIYNIYILIENILGIGNVWDHIQSTADLMYVGMI